MKYPDNTSREQEYRITFGVSLIATQLVFILLFKFWPNFELNRPFVETFQDRGIELDMIDITTQTVETPPKPPTPQIPVPVPDDYIIEDHLDLEDLSETIHSDFGQLNLPAAEGETLPHENPQRPPNVIRIVEPVVPSDARQAKIRAQIIVTFLVSDEGIVEEVTISEIRLFENGDDYRIVENIGYGLIEATLNAAIKWRFRPAEDDGEKVQAYSRHIFTYGI